MNDLRYTALPTGCSVVPSSGGGTYECKCPGSTVTCQSNQNCTCDFAGARCV
ncbi:hypothetical protein [Actinomadura logoneensis]|uniref:hypothetical protein n=1 Tax=Actinomadura logoneensis TaxID=2293572 RepID=UPI001313ED40|nr:hypothetical protein [Actinomadura logoneensis]